MICVWLKETLDRLIDLRSVWNTTCTFDTDSFICSGLMLPLTIGGGGGSLIEDDQGGRSSLIEGDQGGGGEGFTYCDKLNTLSGFIPKVVGSTVGERVRGHGNVVRILVGSVTAEQACNAWGGVYPGSIPRVYALSVGLPGGLILLYFLLLVSVSLIIVLQRLVPRPMFVPKRRSQRGVVDSRAITTLSLLLETPPFIGPNSLSLDNYISRDQYVTSDAGFLIPSYINFQH